MNLKKLTDTEAAAAFHVSNRNLLQTYKNPKPTQTKPIISKEELQKKTDQYEIIRLGATCKINGISEEELIRLIELSKAFTQK